MIPAEAVEAAAKIHQNLQARRGHPTWDELGESGRFGQQLRLDYMAAALEAAAPYLLADMRPMTMVEIANRDHPERMEVARKKLQEGARESRRIERMQVAAKALMDAAKRLQQDNPANAVMWLRDQGRTIGITARQEAEALEQARGDD